MMTFKKTILSLAICLTVTATMAANTPINQPKNNAWLADSIYPTSHHNSAQTDASPIAGPEQGKQLTEKNVKRIPSLFNSQPVVKWIGKDRIIIESGVLGARKILATGDKFEEIAFTPWPGLEGLSSAENEKALVELAQKLDNARMSHDDAAILALSKDMESLGFSFKTVANGVYNFVDKDGFHYAMYSGVNIAKSSDNGKVNAALDIVKTVNITDGLPEDVKKHINRAVGFGMTYDGNIAVAAPGMIALFNRDLEMLDYITFPGEYVDNSIAFDESGIYAVTSEHMVKVVWNGKKLSMDQQDGGWKSAYDTVDAKKALEMGSFSRGSGTTPTLMGFGDDEDKLVLISDADEKGAKLVAFWRNEIPADFKQIPGTQSRRIAGEIRLGISQVTAEASPVVNGYGVLVQNAQFVDPSPVLGDIFGNIFTSGVTRTAPRGLAKFDWNPVTNKFTTKWVDYSVDNTDTMVPTISIPSNTVYLPSKTGLRYEMVGLNWTTGEVIGRWPMPTTSSTENWSLGINYFLEDGDMLVGGFFSSKRIDFNK